jgi:hypothetical protein
VAVRAPVPRRDEVIKYERAVGAQPSELLQAKRWVLDCLSNNRVVLGGDDLVYCRESSASSARTAAPATN